MGRAVHTVGSEGGPVHRGTKGEPVVGWPAYGGAMEGFADVEFRRSRRRRKTISARRDGDRLVVLVPAGLSAAAEQRYARELGAKILARERRRPATDPELRSRAAALSDRYLEGRAVPTSVRWVTNQSTRWGSCTPGEGTIRLSHRLQEMPGYVVDYVLLHELVHLLVPGHGPDFHAWLDRYPQVERASSYLEGWSHRDRAGEGSDGPVPDGDDVDDGPAWAGDAGGDGEVGDPLGYDDLEDDGWDGEGLSPAG